MIYLSSDHRGFLRKEEIKEWLKFDGQEFEDVGNSKLDPEDDEVDFVKKAVEQMKDGDKGIFFCGSGVMVDMVANREGLRSCLGFDATQVKMARSDDNVNVLSVGTDFIDLEKTKKMVAVFLETPFSGEERYKRRLAKI